MNEIARRRAAITMPVIGMTLFGAAWLNVTLATLLAPNSLAAAIVSLVALPAVLIVGLYGWIGASLVILMPRLLARLAKRYPFIPEADMPHPEIPPGTWVFLPIGTIAGFTTSIPVALASALPAAFIVTVFVLVGAAFGAVVRMMADRGFLPFPE